MVTTREMCFFLKACCGSTPHSQDSLWSWIVCFSAFMSNAVISGILTTFGMFLPALIEHFNASRQKTAWIPSIALSLEMLAGPVSGYLCDKVGCRVTAVTGAVLCIVGLVISSTAQSIELIIFSFGILFGIGSCFTYVSGNLVVSQYFTKWRSLVLGIVIAADGAGGFAMSPVVERLLKTFGWRITLRIMASMVTVSLLFPLVYSPNVKTSEVKCEKGMAQHSTVHVKTNLESKNIARRLKDYCSVWGNLVFALVSISSAVASFSENVPVVHMAKHAEDLGYSEKQASQLYGAMGIATVLAGPSLGGLCSFVNPTGLLVVSMLINGIATVLLPLAKNYSMLLLYTVLYGICDAGFVAVGDIMILNCVSEDKRASAYGLYFMLLAIFSVPGPPLTGLLADNNNTYSQSFHMSGSISILSALILCLLPVLEHSKNSTNKRTKSGAATELLLVCDRVTSV